MLVTSLPESSCFQQAPGPASVMFNTLLSVWTKIIMPIVKSVVGFFTLVLALPMALFKGIGFLGGMVGDLKEVIAVGFHALGHWLAALPHTMATACSRILGMALVTIRACTITPLRSWLSPIITGTTKAMASCIHRCRDLVIASALFVYYSFMIPVNRRLLALVRATPPYLVVVRGAVSGWVMMLWRHGSAIAGVIMYGMIAVGTKVTKAMARFIHNGWDLLMAMTLFVYYSVVIPLGHRLMAHIRATPAFVGGIGGAVLRWAMVLWGYGSAVAAVIMNRIMATGTKLRAIPRVVEDRGRRVRYWVAMMDGQDRLRFEPWWKIALILIKLAMRFITGLPLIPPLYFIVRIYPIMMGRPPVGVSAIQ